LKSFMIFLFFVFSKFYRYWWKITPFCFIWKWTHIIENTMWK
jgi:hypothetical protein